MIKNLLGDDQPEPDVESQQSRRGSSDMSLGLLDQPPQTGSQSGDPKFLDYEPQSIAETVRRSGLAWSAGVAFFAAVAFMMILGWGADLLLGTAPWGIVAGIILGSIIGFIQFFRLASQIFKD